MRSIPTMRIALLLTVLAAIGMLAVACSSDDAEPTAVPQATTATEATAVPAADDGDKEISREDTLVVTFFGPGATQIEDPENMNPYSLGGLGRVRGILNKTIFEFLYLYNHNTGEQIPWLAESYTVADDFLSVDVTLRSGVEWSDGVAFTSEDVKFTIDTLLGNEDLVFASDVAEWVKDVTITDDQNFTINLNKPNPRFFYFYFVENSEIHLPILAKHAWEGQDPLEWNNFDLDKGYPLGTGSYTLVQATGQAQVFDRNDDWWGAKVGFHDLPEPLRVTYIPPGGADTMAARMINNEFDVGSIMQPGVFVAANNRNPDVISWSLEGPSYGAADACLYTLGLNTQYGVMSDVHVRRAIQAAINRDQIIELAYESSTVAQVVPYSTYGGLVAYQDKQSALIDQYNPGLHSQDLVDSEMAAAGWAKDGDGMWAKDGATLTTDVLVPGWLKPMGPVVEKQLRDAGFDITFALHDPDSAPLFEQVRTGQADAWILVHCGSSAEPHGTLQHYHSKFSSPSQGEQNSYIWANSQYNNPVYDAIIDQMDSILPSPDDPKYMALADEALELFLSDVIEITLAEERHVITFNTSHWTGWANTGDPYVAPYSLWAGFLLEIMNITKAN